MLDNYFKGLKRGGIGCKTNNSDIIFKQEESQLSDFFESSFYFNRKKSCLQGVARIKELTPPSASFE